MELSCCLWALTANQSHQTAIAQVAELGFGVIDVQPQTVEPAQVSAAGLRVSCVALSHGAPEDCSLDDEDASSLSRALSHAYEALDYASTLGATTGYVVPRRGGGAASLPRYAGALALVADRAADHGIRLGVEHFPGTALPSVAATLRFLREVDHPNLALLFDIGHAQMSRENPAAAIAAAGNLLSYVHLDDNDGVEDLHQALTDGIMTRDSLAHALQAVETSPYDGPASLELNPQLPEPAAALAGGRALFYDVASSR